MSITGLEPVSSYNSGSSSTGVSSLDKNAFLNLLVTQLRHQDPLSPMDSTQFTAQLAQFGSLEQLSSVNENLGILQLYQASINNSQAVGFIGKTVKSHGDSFYLAEDVPAEMHFDLAEEASEVFIHIYDSSGDFVKTVDCGSLNAGEQSIEWDGTDAEGNELPEGSYTFEVIATDANGEEIAATTFMINKVTGVMFEEGVTYLLAGDLKIAIGNVVEIREG
jgi:flagellar basal-body rod modification protein FlgD